MKKNLLIFGLGLVFVLAWLFYAHQVTATDFPVAQSANTATLTLLSTTTSNKTGTAQFLEANSLHTFQIVTICTNAVSNIISGSLDGNGWVALATNAVSASATNGIILIGYRFSYLRADFYQTTASGSTNTVLYLGARY